MNRVVGILAHVDAGKTTLSEQLLCHAGALRKAGRVDHGDTLLDAHPLERQRGITIFSDQAVFERGGTRFFWVDTPGHADFAAEMERALSILDCAVLVVSGAEGIQSHTETLWALLRDYGVPTLLFINKTDRAACDADAVLAQLKKRLSPDIVDAQGWDGGELPAGLIEAVAERDEALLDRWIAGDYEREAWLRALRQQVTGRALFPVWRGSALNDAGVAGFLDGLVAIWGKERSFDSAAAPLRMTPEAEACHSERSDAAGGTQSKNLSHFDALVYKVRRDAQGNRLCFFKVLSGGVAAREAVAVPGGSAKLNELRLYSGAKYTPVQLAEPGMLCAATGLGDVRPGDYIGADAGRRNAFRTEPMMAASVTCDAAPTGRLLEALRQLEEEDPALGVACNEATGAIDLRVMGEIQLEVLKQLMLDRFGLAVEFGPMRVLYMETVAAPAVGVGHYEPLRHYAEVQLRLVPGSRGSGVRFESKCHVDELALNWQRLIETHVYEKAHRGVLTGAPLTDVVVQLLHGRAHLKHTEGGDFRQSTYRAIRNALMYAQSVLLEPICRFTLRAPQDSYGRVMGDLTRMHAVLEPPRMEGEAFALTGEAAFAAFAAYNTDFLAATHGRGTLSYRLDHYAPCRDAEAVIAAANYNPLADDTPDSVFCAHGAGYTVPWNEVRAHAHCSVEK